MAEGTRDWGVRKFSADDDDVSAILGQAQTMPMLAPQQVIFVSDVEAWERLGDDSRDSLVKQISEYLDNPAPFSVLVFEAAALDQRMRLAKMFAEKTVTVSVELSDDPAERVPLAVPVVPRNGAGIGSELERDAAEELCEILNGELAAIRTELEKLVRLCGRPAKNHARGRRSPGDLRAKILGVGTGGHAGGAPAGAGPGISGQLVAGGRSRAGLARRAGLDVPETSRGAGIACGRPSGWQAASRLKMRSDAAELAVRQSQKISEGAAHERTGRAVRGRQPLEIRRNKSARRDGIPRVAARFLK